MGCCISKCRPEHNYKNPLQQQHINHELFNHNNNNVEDIKLVISQAHPKPQTPPIIIPPRPYYPKYKASPSPHSPTASSTSSVSSFTCTTTSNTIYSASTASSASKLDRSFSNEFLLSCYKDNPHILRINSLRGNNKPNNIINPSPPTPRSVLKPHSPLHNVVAAGSSFSTMPQKRVRSNSPTNLTRQKSFRKDTAIRTIGSPSPSRRFSINGSDKCDITTNSFSKGPKVSSVRSSSVRKEISVKGAVSPNNNTSSSFGRQRVHQSCSGLRRRETCTYRVGSKIDETVVRDVLSKDGDHMDLDSMEVDIDNPLISLDCFIFL